MSKINRSDAQWRAVLSAEQYAVCRQGATERPFSGAYYRCPGPGQFLCVCCHTPLFDAACQFDAGCGWPSYWQPLAAERLRELTDTSHGMLRTEVRCAACDAHLGHVFDDGPPPTGLRYCINSVALQWRAAD